MKRLFRVLVRERVVMSMIVINALAVFFYPFQDAPEALRGVLYWIDYGCTIYFIIEIVIKISLQRWTRFWESGWNRFDFTVVALSLPFLLTPLPFVSLEGFGAIVLLRLGRLLRLLRLFYFIPNPRALQRGIARALRASVGVFFVLFLYTFILTLFSHFLFQDYSPEHFGDPLLSLYSMFQILTVEGWHEIPGRIAQDASGAVGPLARAYFAFSVFTGGILGLSLANAVFVDEMVMDNNDPLEAEVKDLRQNLNEYIDESTAKQEDLKAMIADLQAQLGDDPDDTEE